jgi:hypothetical protein
VTNYAYTYDARQDYAGAEHLTDAQRDLMDRINQQARAGESSGDRYVLLVAADAAGADKAALAEVWGGPGAGEEFQR